MSEIENTKGRDKLTRRWIASAIIEKHQLDGAARDRVIREAYAGKHDDHPRADELAEKAGRYMAARGARNTHGGDWPERTAAEIQRQVRAR